MRYLFLCFLGWSLTSCSGSGSSGDALFADGKFSEAIEAYTQELELSGNDENIKYNRSRAYEENGQYQVAIKELNEILENNPRYVRAHLSLAKIAYTQENYAKSIMHANNGLDITETSKEAYLFKARSQHQLGYMDLALANYDRAISLDEEYGEAYLYRGALKQSVGSPDACADIKKAASLQIEGAKGIFERYCE